MIKKADAVAKPGLFELATLKIKVVGISPLLCHNPAGSMQAPTGAMKRGTSKIPEPEAEAKAGLYLDADGDIAFPNASLFAAIVAAAELMKLKVGNGRYDPTVATVLRGGLSASYEVELVKLLDPKTGKSLKDYTVDSRRAVIPANGSSVIRSRPRFDAWSATFVLQADSGDPNLMAILDSTLPEILRYAGVRVGLGDFRAYIKPPKGDKKKQSLGGPFGKFSAVVA